MDKVYIDREEAKRVMKANDWLNPAIPNVVNMILDRLPAADVAPVVHGEWVIKSEIHKIFDDVDENMYVECPFCKRTYYVPQTYDDEEIITYAREQYPYCNCGAKMDGGKHG